MEKPSAPSSLELEHKELHQKLVEAINIHGKTGDAAKVVAQLLHPHFEKEEEYAMPPLGLLAMITKGGRRRSEITKAKGTMQQNIIAMTDKLKEDLPNMLKEHKEILSALGKFVDAAKEENKPEYAHFGEKLMIHAHTEEEVLYPAAILVGEYLKLKST